MHSVLVERQQLHKISDLLVAEIPIYIIPENSVSRLVGFDFHRGIMACGVRPRAVRWRELARNHQRLKLVVCSHISDLENLGGIVRNAAAFGSNAIVVGPGCGDIFSRRVARVSMGTVFDLCVDFVDDLESNLESMRDEFEIEVFATVLDESAEALPSVRTLDRFALVFGNEGHGLQPQVIAACHRRITVPIREGIDSLNVATSVGIFLYHFSDVDHVNR